MIDDHSRTLDWYDASTAPLGGVGFPRSERARPFQRMPASFEAVAPEAVWDLSCQSAGVFVDFQTDSEAISGRWTVGGERAIGQGCGTRFAHLGLDCYGRDPGGSWQWVGAMDPPADGGAVGLHREGLSPNGERRYRIYLPLFRETEELEIGVTAGARFRFVAPEGRPVVFYGTSICQGHECSRPGLCHINVLNRWLDLPTINLGFSGRGRMEPVIAEYLSTIDARLYVIDCLPNLWPEAIAERVGPFIDILRAARPDTPILFVGDRLFGDHAFRPSMRDHQRENTDAQRAALVPRLTQDRRLHLLDGVDFFGPDGTDDGSHPNDLGYHRFAEHLAPAIATILADEVTPIADSR